MLIKDYPDHHDAELIIKLYDLRREAVMRESRSVIMAQLWPRSWDDVQAIMNREHPLNRPFRQVHTYWEMAYGMVKHGVLHGDFMIESCGEGMYVYARMEPYVARYRAEINGNGFVNAEWIAAHSPAAGRVLDHFRSRVKKTLADGR